MNPYEPPDDESQLDRIERKVDRLNGWYLLTLIIGGELTALGFLLVEILGRWKF
jgi:hypothetical protein